MGPIAASIGLGLRPTGRERERDRQTDRQTEREREIYIYYVFIFLYIHMHEAHIGSPLNLIRTSRNHVECEGELSRAQALEGNSRCFTHGHGRQASWQAYLYSGTKNNPDLTP